MATIMSDYWERLRPSMEQTIAEYDAGGRQRDRVLVNKYKRKLRMMDAQKKGTHTKEQWAAMKVEFKFRCVRCLIQSPEIKDFLVKDHIIPVYQGGSDGLDNIQPLCPHCNASKGPESFNWCEYRRINGLD